jgi:threonine/homoserine/homoserine lactone efflux protein
MTLDTAIPFLLVSLVATATPGPSVLFILSAGLTSGKRGYVPGAAGILTADALYFLLSVVGLGTFLLASYHFFLLVKWAGAAYLIWLGLRLLWLAFVRAEGMAVDAAKAPTQTRWFSGGFMLHAANPKALLYFGSIVPQFLRPAEPLLPQIAALGVIHLLTALTVVVVYGFFASRLQACAHNPWFSRSLHGVSGTMLIAAGVGLASIKQKS